MSELSLIQHLSQQIQHQQYLIAFSGGLDSTVLLSLFAQLKKTRPELQLRAIHIHHGLSQNADSWLAHCENVCQQLDIPLLFKKVKLSPQGNIEQNARQARYQAIAEQIQPNEILVTAHHLNDQTETFLLALKRGSGLQGLSAMQSYREFQTGGGIFQIFRPLLNISRQALENYAKAQRLNWIEDESNQNNDYDRNFLRNQILPELRQRWQAFDQNVARSAELCHEQQQLINELLAEQFDQYYDAKTGGLNTESFSQFSFAKQANLLRLWLQHQGLPMLSLKQLKQCINDVIFARPDAMPNFQLQDKILRRYQNHLYITPIFQDLKNWRQQIELNHPIQLPDNLGKLWIEEKVKEGKAQFIAYWQTENQTYQQVLPKTNQPLSVGFYYQGKVKLRNQHHEEIKKIWQGLNVPPWQRNRIPLIFVGNQLQTAIGFFSTE